MQQIATESLQAAVRPHECVDTYYAGESNSDVQCFPTTVENRFVVGLPSLISGSSSTVTFNPDGLISDIIVTAQMGAPSSLGAGVPVGLGLGLTRGWLYQLVNRISVRYAGSSLYYFLGEQELIACLADCEDSVKRDQLLALGGAEVTSAADWASASLTTASIYIKLPHNSPSAQEKPIGFPTSEISAPVQIQIEFKPFSSIFLANAVTYSGTTYTQAQVQASIPGSLASGQMQFKQAHLNDRNDAVSSRFDLNKQALSIPLRHFCQSQFSAPLTAVPTPQTVNLTGFRSGSVQGIMVWAVANDSLASVTNKQPLQYLPLQSVELSVNGLVYFTAQSPTAAQMWDLVERKTASQASTTTLAWNGTAAYTPTPASLYWVWIPLAQGVETLRDGSMLSNGLGISNSTVQLQVATGTSAACTLYASYYYNASILASGGSCEYVF
jgi:hypothetical protein